MATTELEIAPAPPKRGPRIALWATVVVALTLVGALFVAGKNPSLTPAGMSWQSEAFVGSASGDFVVWDQPDGAWASVVVKNDRPYPVTLSPGLDAPALKVQVAAYDIDSGATSMDPADLEASDHLQVPAGGYAVVSLRVSGRCVDLVAGSSMGTDVAEVKVTTFGVTEPVLVQFPFSYMAGSTTDHTREADCPGT